MGKVLLIVIIAAAAVFFLSFKSKEQIGVSKNKDQTIEISESEDIKGLGYSGQNKLVSDSEGNIFATYRKKAGEQYAVFVSKIVFDGNDIKVLDTVNVSGINPDLPSQRVGSLAVDKKDNIHLAWYGEEAEGDSGRQIKYSKSEDKGKKWADPVTVSFVEGFSDEDLWQEHPSIAIGKDNEIYIAWEGKDKTHSSQQIKFSKSIDGIKWSDWKNILPDSASAQSRPNILIDSKGNLFVLAYSRNGLENQQIWFTKSEDQGGVWSPWGRVSVKDSDARHVDAVIDEKDNIHIVWRQEGENKKAQIYYSLFDGEKFPEPAVVASSNNYQFFPQTGIGEEAQVYVAWIETENKSSFPQDDPEKGNIFISSKNTGETNFGAKKMISVNSLYPNVWLKSELPGGTMVIYSKVNGDSYPVNISTIYLSR